MRWISGGAGGAGFLLRSAADPGGRRRLLNASLTVENAEKGPDGLSAAGTVRSGQNV